MFEARQQVFKNTDKKQLRFSSSFKNFLKSKRNKLRFRRYKSFYLKWIGFPIKRRRSFKVFARNNLRYGEVYSFRLKNYLNFFKYNTGNELILPYPNSVSSFASSFYKKGNSFSYSYIYLLNEYRSLKKEYAISSTKRFSRDIKALAKKNPSSNFSLLPYFLESQISTLLFRTHRLSSVFESVQLIRHKFIEVDGLVVTRSNTKLSPLSYISLSENLSLFKKESTYKSLLNSFFYNNKLKFDRKHLFVDFSSLVFYLLLSNNTLSPVSNFSSNNSFKQFTINSSYTKISNQYQSSLFSTLSSYRSTGISNVDSLLLDKVFYIFKSIFREFYLTLLKYYFNYLNSVSPSSKVESVLRGSKKNVSSVLFNYLPINHVYLDRVNNSKYSSIYLLNKKNHSFSSKISKFVKNNLISGSALLDLDIPLVDSSILKFNLDSFFDKRFSVSKNKPWLVRFLKKRYRRRYWQRFYPYFSFYRRSFWKTLPKKSGKRPNYLVHRYSYQYNSPLLLFKASSSGLLRGYFEVFSHFRTFILNKSYLKSVLGNALYRHNFSRLFESPILLPKYRKSYKRSKYLNQRPYAFFIRKIFRPSLIKKTLKKKRYRYRTLKRRFFFKKNSFVLHNNTFSSSYSPLLKDSLDFTNSFDSIPSISNSFKVRGILRSVKVVEKLIFGHHKWLYSRLKRYNRAFRWKSRRNRKKNILKKKKRNSFFSRKKRYVESPGLARLMFRGSLPSIILGDIRLYHKKKIVSDSKKIYGGGLLNFRRPKTFVYWSSPNKVRYNGLSLKLIRKFIRVRNMTQVSSYIKLMTLWMGLESKSLIDFSVRGSSKKNIRNFLKRNYSGRRRYSSPSSLISVITKKGVRFKKSKSKRRFKTFMYKYKKSFVRLVKKSGISIISSLYKSYKNRINFFSRRKIRSRRSRTRNLSFFFNKAVEYSIRQKVRGNRFVRTNVVVRGKRFIRVRRYGTEIKSLNYWNRRLNNNALFVLRLQNKPGSNITSFKRYFKIRRFSYFFRNALKLPRSFYYIDSLIHRKRKRNRIRLSYLNSFNTRNFGRFTLGFNYNTSKYSYGLFQRKKAISNVFRLVSRKGKRKINSKFSFILGNFSINSTYSKNLLLLDYFLKESFFISSLKIKLNSLLNNYLVVNSISSLLNVLFGKNLLPFLLFEYKNSFYIEDNEFLFKPSYGGKISFFIENYSFLNKSLLYSNVVKNYLGANISDLNNVTLNNKNTMSLLDWVSVRSLDYKKKKMLLGFFLIRFVSFLYDLFFLRLRRSKSYLLEFSFNFFFRSRYSVDKLLIVYGPKNSDLTLSAYFYPIVFTENFSYSNKFILSYNTYLDNISKAFSYNTIRNKDFGEVDVFSIGSLISYKNFMFSKRILDKNCTINLNLPSSSKRFFSSSKFMALSYKSYKKNKFLSLSSNPLLLDFNLLPEYLEHDYRYSLTLLSHVPQFNELPLRKSLDLHGLSTYFKNF